MIITNHALKRMAQRSIKMIDVDLILEYGTSKSRPGGAFEYYIEKENIPKIISGLKHTINQIDRLKDKAVLVIDNKIKTVYHKHN